MEMGRQSCGAIIESSLPSFEQMELFSGKPGPSESSRIDLAWVIARFEAKGLSTFQFKPETTPRDLAAFWEACWVTAEEIGHEIGQALHRLDEAAAEIKRSHRRSGLRPLRERRDELNALRDAACAYGEAKLMDAQEEFEAGFDTADLGVSEVGGLFEQLWAAFSERPFLEYTWEWPLSQIIQHCRNNAKREVDATPL